MNLLKKSRFIATTVFLMFFTACSDNKPPVLPKTVSISITQTLSLRVGETATLNVTRQNTDDFKLSVNPASGSGCVKSGNSAVTCKPTMADIYTITVSATADETKKASATVTVTDNQQATYSVSFNTNGGTSVPASSVRQGEAISTSPTTTCTGYTFDGWYASSSFSGSPVIFPYTPTANITLYAKWTPLENTERFTTIDRYPNIDITVLYGINDIGQIVGEFEDSLMKSGGGFLKDGGSYTAINYPGAKGGSYAFGINNSGQIAGFYYDSSYIAHGFLKDGDTYISIDYPGATDTGAYGINNLGQIVGTYYDSSDMAHGFLKDGGTYTAIDYPGAIRTEAYGINDSGQIVGVYYDSSYIEHGFLKNGGSYTAINYPGADKTHTYGINNSGQIVGDYYNYSSSMSHGFLKDGGSYPVISHPNVALGGNGARGINNPGQIVGDYAGADGNIHGFLLER